MSTLPLHLAVAALFPLSIASSSEHSFLEGIWTNTGAVQDAVWNEEAEDPRFICSMHHSHSEVHPVPQDSLKAERKGLALFSFAHIYLGLIVNSQNDRITH